MKFLSYLAIIIFLICNANLANAYYLSRYPADIIFNTTVCPPDEYHCADRTVFTIDVINGSYLSYGSTTTTVYVYAGGDYYYHQHLILCSDNGTLLDSEYFIGTKMYSWDSYELIKSASPSSSMSCAPPPCTGEIPSELVDTDGDGVCDTCDSRPDDPDYGDNWYMWTGTYQGDDMVYAGFTDSSDFNSGGNSYYVGDPSAEGAIKLFIPPIAFPVPACESCGNCDPLGSLSGDPLGDLSSDPSLPPPEDCNDVASPCFDICSDRGGVSSFNCYYNDQGDPVSDDCVCKDNFSVEDEMDSYDSDGNTTDGTYSDNGSDTDNGALNKIVDNTAKINDNLGVLNENMKDGFSTLSENMQSLQDTMNNNALQDHDQLNDINDSLHDINNNLDQLADSSTQDQEVVAGDYTGIGETDGYDTTYTQPESESIGDTITEYIKNGLPFVDVINNSGFSTSNIDPNLTTNFYGREINFSLEEYEDILDWMGKFFIALCTIKAFFIVIKRG